MTTEDAAVKLEAVDGRARANTRRIEALEKRMAENDRMLNTIALIAQRQDTMDSDIKEIKGDVKLLASKPARRWELVVERLILAAAAAVAAYIMARIGL